MSKDPLAAGAYIRQSLDRGLEELGGPSPDIVKNLSDIESQQQAAASRKNIFAPKVDVEQANPLRTITQELVRDDMRMNPEFYGLTPRDQQ